MKRGKEQNPKRRGHLERGQASGGHGPGKTGTRTETKYIRITLALARIHG